ncbi:MAG: thiamine pyrophosphate-dependent enzyme, partial [Comamonadaceae bacterium]|nr:thiamine pyrophosphate-dependent enzyme [Comamonadaceae bacterium]
KLRIAKVNTKTPTTSLSAPGQDIEVVYEAARKAVDHVRSGNGPFFLELMTYRYRGHSMSDSRGYRSREEEEEWKQRDPIFLLRDRLIAEKAITMADYEAMEKETDAYIENEVIKFSEESPEPRVEDLEKYVFADRETHAALAHGQGRLRPGF